MPDCLTSLPLGYQGKVECWDPRVRNRVGMLDCALSSLTEGTEYVPSCHSEMSNHFSLTMYMSPHGNVLHCLRNELQAVHHYGTLQKYPQLVNYPITQQQQCYFCLHVSLCLIMVLFVFLLTESKVCPQLVR